MAEITVFYEGPIVTRAQAVRDGLRKYFTGKPCKHGHIAERAIAQHNACVECLRLAKAAYSKRRNRSAEGKAARAAYRSTAAVKEKERRNAKKQRQRPAMKRLRCLWEGTRRARKQNVQGIFSAEDEAKLRERQKKCHICGRRFTKSNPATIDHVIALGDPSGLATHDLSNIALAHRSCNSSKSDKRIYLI